MDKKNLNNNTENQNNKIDTSQQEKLKSGKSKVDREKEIRSADPKELRKKLSNKNEDYVFRLEKSLNDAPNVSMDMVEPAIDEILPEIMIAQQKGIPASTLYQKSPIEKAQDLMKPKEKPANSNFWLQVLDNTLLYLAVFAGFYGVIELTSKPKGGQLGVFTLLSVVIVFGIIMAYFNNLMVMPKEKRPPMWKIILIGIALILFVLFWITVSSLPQLKVINPVLPAWVELAAAVIAIVVRMYIRKKYNIIDPAKQARLKQAQSRD